MFFNFPIFGRVSPAELSQILNLQIKSHVFILLEGEVGFLGIPKHIRFSHHWDYDVVGLVVGDQLCDSDEDEEKSLVATLVPSKMNSTIELQGSSHLVSLFSEE
jgi:hypothetical protein